MGGCRSTARQSRRPSAGSSVRGQRRHLWQIGTPDLIVTSPAVEMKAISPDYWGALAAVPTGLSEDRYVAAMEIKEVNDSRNKPGRATVGGLFVFHHAIDQCER